MIIESLKNILSQNQKQANKAYLRNLLKESLQLYVLNFVYSSPSWRKLIFTGGTCLRRCFGLPRLSEDLDFDIEEKQFNFNAFTEDLAIYFKEKLQYSNLTINFKKNQQILFLKFPVLEKLGFAAPSESNILFVRCDLSFNLSKKFTAETNLISTYDFSFIVRNYDLSSLFANKITAFLTREFRKGKNQKEPFKGRDVFDLAWFIEQSQKTSWNLKPNFPRIQDLTEIKTREELINKIINKIKRIEEKILIEDLKSFLPDAQFVKNFAKIYQSLIVQNISKVI